MKEGKEAKWKNLDEVWDLKRDEMRFKLYIADEIKKFRVVGIYLTVVHVFGIQFR